jgi:hypothetical protein
MVEILDEIDVLRLPLGERPGEQDVGQFDVPVDQPGGEE